MTPLVIVSAWLKKESSDERLRSGGTENVYGYVANPIPYASYSLKQLCQLTRLPEKTIYQWFYDVKPLNSMMKIEISRFGSIDFSP